MQVLSEGFGLDCIFACKGYDHVRGSLNCVALCLKLIQGITQIIYSNWVLKLFMWFLFVIRCVKMISL